MQGGVKTEGDGAARRKSKRGTHGRATRTGIISRWQTNRWDGERGQAA
jgi:hypothetical protein